MSKTKEAKKKEPRFNCRYGKKVQDDLLAWWRSMHDSSGDRAQLRRCVSPEEAVLHPQTHRLTHVLPWVPLEAVATVAGLLSHVKSGEGDSSSVGHKLAKPTEPGGSPPFSETRFRQLLGSRDWNDFYRNFRRAIQILGGDVNPLLVADTILCWGREYQGKEPTAPGKSLKFRLSQDYYTEALKHESKSK